MKIYKFFRLFNTVKYLKFIQIFYRLFYYIRRHARQWRGFTYCLSYDTKSTKLSFCSSIPSVDSYSKGTFTFLNLSHKFDSEIDWNFSDFGKLWTYNLTYFEFLNQKEISQDKGLKHIDDFINQIKFVKDGMEPYPISLRGINWIKFLTKYQIKNQKIDDSLYAQYKILMDNLEYHLLGNHLLENAFSLLFGAYYFQDEKLYKKAKKILEGELEEQILEDGAHFELSPMYHQIMLFRVLDCINLVQNNSLKNQELLELLISKARLMLDWLNIITFENGDIPLLNDSTNKIAPTTEQLNDYAGSLQISNCYQPSIINHQLSESGYRKIRNDNYEIIVDVGNIGPDYIPGHAHSDMFSFVLYINKHPFIVDPGISTYETNNRRQLERSTCFHNTVEVDGKNQSDVWGGFRVAKRAKIIECKEIDNTIKATHDGYMNKGILHTRKFIFKTNEIIINDIVKGKQGDGDDNIAYLHFYPGINAIKDNNVIICDKITIEFIGAKKLLLKKYEYAPEFNKRDEAIYAAISFETELSMQISGMN